jgi:hypothetical protein
MELLKIVFMRSIKNLSWRKALAGGILCVTVFVWMVACKPDSGALGGLGPKPKPDFALVNSGTNPNSVILVNKSSGPDIPYWTVSWTAGSTTLNQKFSKDSALLNFPFAGTYALNVTLLVAGNGGLDSVTKVVNVTINQNDPAACKGTLQGFIAGCSQKVWKLAPVAYAEMVGPNEGDGSWFGTGAAEVTGDRVCDFNDVYTFVFNAAGTYQFDNLGDYFADSYLGPSNNACATNNLLPAAQLPWASGSFTYSVATGGTAGLGQLTVSGLGAHIGFAKVQGGGHDDVTAGPVVNSITYDVLSMGHNAAANYDSVILACKTSYGGWTYQLRSN